MVSLVMVTSSCKDHKATLIVMVNTLHLVQLLRARDQTG